MKIFNIVFMAAFFYILGLNTHNSVWKWLDESRRSKDSLPSFVSEVPDTIGTSLSLNDQCIIDSLFAPMDRSFDNLMKTIDELNEAKTARRSQPGGDQFESHRTDGELRAYEAPRIAIYFTDTTRFTIKPDSMENHLTDNMYKQWDIEDSLMRRRIKRDSVIQTQ